jgi:hypothetical protein
MSDVIPAPAVFRVQVISVLVNDSQIIPFVGIIVSVVRERIAGLKLKAAVSVPETENDGVVIGSSAALLLPQDTERRIRPEKAIKSRSQHRRR